MNTFSNLRPAGARYPPAHKAGFFISKEKGMFMEMVKVRILNKCQDCDGQAYLPSGIGVDSRGVEYQRYLRCPTCNGSGQTGKWITLPEFQQLLKENECPHEHISQVGGFHFSEGCVDDNIQDVCRDCGQVLD